MKRVKEFKKMFALEGPLELKQLKKQYRNLVKEWHPDKFPNGGEKAEEAEAMRDDHRLAHYMYRVVGAP